MFLDLEEYFLNVQCYQVIFTARIARLNFTCGYCCLVQSKPVCVWLFLFLYFIFVSPQLLAVDFPYPSSRPHTDTVFVTSSPLPTQQEEPVWAIKLCQTPGAVFLYHDAWSTDAGLPTAEPMITVNSNQSGYNFFQFVLYMRYRLHCEILPSSNSNKNMNISPWIGKQP